MSIITRYQCDHCGAAASKPLDGWWSVKTYDRRSNPVHSGEYCGLGCVAKTVSRLVGEDITYTLAVERCVG